MVQYCGAYPPIVCNGADFQAGSGRRRFAQQEVIGAYIVKSLVGIIRLHRITKITLFKVFVMAFLVQVING